MAEDDAEIKDSGSPQPERPLSPKEQELIIRSLDLYNGMSEEKSRFANQEKIKIGEAKFATNKINNE